VPSDYQGELGHHENLYTVGTYLQPEIFRRLLHPLQYDFSYPVQNVVHVDDDGSAILMDIPFEVMRKILENHFSYRFAKNDIKWTSRNGVIKLVN
jgi:hypothetical protein